jgi:hypothetical protein
VRASRRHPLCCSVVVLIVELVVGVFGFGVTTRPISGPVLIVEDA